MHFDYWLTLQTYIGQRTKRNLVHIFGSAKKLFNAKEKALVETGLIDMERANRLVEGAKSFNLKEFENLKREGIEFCHVFCDEYPDNLKDIYDAPYGIFYKGSMPKSFKYAVAVVGARRCSAYGRVATFDIAYEIAKSGGLVVSGMARGVDGFSHAGALKADMPTVAVLGCGVDVCYPMENKGIYESIIKNGCIISELPPKTAPLPPYFPQRNRIISGLSRATVIVEAAEKSGSLITADCALEQGRDVFALPGRITDKLCEGCNRLIEEGAGIIRSPKALVKTLSEAGYLPEADKTLHKNQPIKLDKNEEAMLKILDYSPVGIDELLSKSSFEYTKVFSILNNLENKGLIREEGKNRFVLNSL